MRFARTDEQRLLADNLRRFFQQKNDFEHRRRRLAQENPDRLALWPGLAEIGVIGAAFDEASGGFAGDARSIAIVMSEVGRALAVEPLLGCAVVAGRLLRHAGDAATIEKIVAGEHIVVLAHDAGSDPFAKPLATATRRGDQIELAGRVRGVRHADVAQEFLVSAMLGDTVTIVRVPRAALSFEPYRMMDGSGAAELRLDGVGVPASAELALGDDAAGALRDALEWGLVGLAAETAGIVEALNAATFAYLTTRKQFGVVIGSFQALQHRAADLYIANEEIGALVDLAADALENAPSDARSSIVSCAKTIADTGGRRVGHDAIQMHGGMGVSDELDISHYGRRLAAIRMESGCADVHRLRVATLGVDVAELLAQQESAPMREWRAQVRAFVKEHLPADLASKGAKGLKPNKEDFVRWQKILYQEGWFAGAWPREAGGQGWDLRKQLVFMQESTACNAPAVVPYGVNMVGPVLYSFGNEEQKRQHLPGILSSDVWWCQGYSEPGAGSDLASLKTFAERDGDHYVINGSKMWTTEAHWADWMHCLVRTDRAGKPQTGISFLLIDMNTPGITIKPIVTIDGVHHTNATFFDNVRVPVANRVGAEGQGWTFAKFLLGNERVAIGDTGPKLRTFRHVRERHRAAVSSRVVPDGIKHLLTAKLGDAAIQLLTLCALERHYIDIWSDGKQPGADASTLKIRGTEVLQAISELAMELEGPLAAAHDPHDLHLSGDEPLTAPQRASTVGHEYLYGRCWSVFGGTNEIQRNLIARQVLGV